MTALTVFSAGSLRYALPEICHAFHAQTGIECQLELGPAGLLRQRIEQGEPCDIFVSASPEHIVRLKQKIQKSAPLASNKLGIVVRKNFLKTDRTWLDLLADESLKIGTSTPQNDPCGDYCWQLFDNIEQCYPTFGEKLKQRALQLVGGSPSSVKIPEGEMAAAYLLQQGYADLFIGYAHYQSRLAQIPDLALLDIPAEFNPPAIYVTGLLRHNPATTQFFDFLQSEQAKEILQTNSFGLIKE